jgi:6-methylsalicylate decarboxylase
VSILADRINEFMHLFLGAHRTDRPDAVTQLRRLYYDIAATAFPRQVPALLGLADPDQLVFGSDYCWTPPAVADAHLAAFDAAASAVDDATWRALTTANARRLLRRSAVG